MNRFKIIGLVVLLSFFACKRGKKFSILNNNSGNVTVPSVNAKGKITLYVRVLHHTYPVKGAWVHLKLNTTNYPGTDTTLYDWHKRADANGYVQFDSLLYSNYYLYGDGFDVTINKNTYGYMPITLNKQTVGSDDEIDATLAVTEPH